MKGAYQIGALMAVRELLVEFDGVVGTSIGAINGAIYLEGGYSKLFDVWNEIQTNTVFFGILYSFSFQRNLSYSVRQNK